MEIGLPDLVDKSLLSWVHPLALFILCCISWESCPNLVPIFSTRGHMPDDDQLFGIGALYCVSHCWRLAY